MSEKDSFDVARLHLEVHTGKIRGHWKVHLRRKTKVNDTALSEILPLIMWLENNEIKGMRPPWPTSEETNLTLTRRVRAAVRSVEQVAPTGSRVSLLSHEAQLDTEPQKQH